MGLRDLNCMAISGPLLIPETRKTARYLWAVLKTRPLISRGFSKESDDAIACPRETTVH